MSALAVDERGGNPQVSRQVQMAVIVGSIALVAVGAFFVLSGDAEKLPGIGKVFQPTVCPLTGEKPSKDSLAERPAVAVKIENSSIAYPLSGLEDADLVYEEVVEGGLTRFMAIYHCGDTRKAGPIRSARAVDPAIMTPASYILAFSGANGQVLDSLEEAGIVQVTEATAGGAMERIPREGLTSEHTLYADSEKARALGAKKYDKPPPDDSFEFGDLPGGSKKASSVEITFSGATVVRYDYSKGSWLRFQNGEPFMAESGDQISVDNVLLEEHEVNYSKIKDVAGNPSTEIADVTGTGRAVLFRDGAVIKGKWRRESIEAPVVFETASGDTMTLAPGTTWIHLVPSAKGEVTGSFSYEK
jgi:Protein of unknown function (DUF3048) N-terminal domain/Protein of unknown function (DUF3048) C-terminal domain